MARNWFFQKTVYSQLQERNLYDVYTECDKGKRFLVVSGVSQEQAEQICAALKEEHSNAYALGVANMKEVIANKFRQDVMELEPPRC